LESRRAAFYLELPTSVHDAVGGSSTGTCVPWMWALLSSHDSEERAMQTITTIGLDIAKSVFQVHGVDAGGQVIVRRQLKRRYVLTFFQKLSLTSQRERRTSGPENFQSQAKKDLFNTIGQERS
jgi:hypothetical protein